MSEHEDVIMGKVKGISKIGYLGLLVEPTSIIMQYRILILSGSESAFLIACLVLIPSSILSFLFLLYKTCTRKTLKLNLLPPPSTARFSIGFLYVLSILLSIYALSDSLSITTALMIWLAADVLAIPIFSHFILATPLQIPVLSAFPIALIAIFIAFFAKIQLNQTGWQRVTLELDVFEGHGWSYVFACFFARVVLCLKGCLEKKELAKEGFVIKSRRVREARRDERKLIENREYVDDDGFMHKRFVKNESFLYRRFRYLLFCAGQKPAERREGGEEDENDDYFDYLEELEDLAKKRKEMEINEIIEKDVNYSFNNLYNYQFFQHALLKKPSIFERIKEDARKKKEQDLLERKRKREEKLKRLEELKRKQEEEEEEEEEEQAIPKKKEKLKNENSKNSVASENSESKKEKKKGKKESNMENLGSIIEIEEEEAELKKEEAGKKKKKKKEKGLRTFEMEHELIEYKYSVDNTVKEHLERMEYKSVVERKKRKEEGSEERKDKESLSSGQKNMLETLVNDIKEVPLHMHMLSGYDDISLSKIDQFLTDTVYTTSTPSLSITSAYLQNSLITLPLLLSSALLSIFTKDQQISLLSFSSFFPSFQYWLLLIFLALLLCFKPYLQFHSHFHFNNYNLCGALFMLNPLVFALGSIFEINPYVDSTDICAFFLLIIAHALALFYSRMHLDSLRDANALETVKSAMCGVFKDQEQIKNMQDKMLQVKAALGIRSYYSILLDLALSKNKNAIKYSASSVLPLRAKFDSEYFYRIGNWGNTYPRPFFEFIESAWKAKDNKEGKEAGIDRDLEDFLDQRQEIKLLLQKLQVPEYMFDYFAIVKEPKRKKLLKHYLQYFLQNKQEEIEKQQIKEKIIEEEEEEASELINIPATIKIIGTKKNTEEEEQSKEEKKSKLESEEIKEKLSRIKEAKKSIRKPIINTLIMNQNNLIKKTEKKGKEKEKQQEKDEGEENEDIDDVEDEDLFDFGRQKHQN